MNKSRITRMVVAKLMKKYVVCGCVRELFQNIFDTKFTVSMDAGLRSYQQK